MKYLIEICVETDTPEALFGPLLPPDLTEAEVKQEIMNRMGTSPIEVATIDMLRSLMPTFVMEFFRIGHLLEEEKLDVETLASFIAKWALDNTDYQKRIRPIMSNEECLKLSEWLIQSFDVKYKQTRLTGIYIVG